MFTDFMRSRLPGTVRLPDVLADFFDWIDGNGWVVRGADNEPYGGLSLGSSWFHDGTSVSFRIDSPDTRAASSASFTSVLDPVAPLRACWPTTLWTLYGCWPSATPRSAGWPSRSTPCHRCVRTGTPLSTRRWGSGFCLGAQQSRVRPARWFRSRPRWATPIAPIRSARGWSGYRAELNAGRHIQPC